MKLGGESEIPGEFETTKLRRRSTRRTKRQALAYSLLALGTSVRSYARDSPFAHEKERERRFLLRDRVPVTGEFELSARLVRAFARAFAHVSHDAARRRRKDASRPHDQSRVYRDNFTVWTRRPTRHSTGWDGSGRLLSQNRPYGGALLRRPRVFSSLLRL